MKSKALMIIISAVTAIALLFSLAACKGKDAGSSDEPQPEDEKRIGDISGIYYTSEGLLVYPYGRIEMPFSGGKSFGIDDASGSFSAAEDADKTSYDFSDSSAMLTHSWSNGKTLTTDVLSNSDGTMDIVQNAVSQDGLSAVSFGFTIPIKNDIIIPAWGGIRLSQEQPTVAINNMTYFAYPREWQMQMFIIQGANGGLLVYAEDDGTQFKALDVTSDDDSFYVRIDTIPQAPFGDYRDFKTVKWHMVAYKGEWMTGAMIYKDFAAEKFDLEAIQAAKPDWSDEIGLYMIDDIGSEEALAALAKEIDPSKTLIIFPGFRQYEYDTHYPDYTPSSDAKERIRYAKSLGFKVGVHINMIGAAFDSEEYLSYLKDSASLDSYTGEVIVEGYTAYGKEFSFAQINQASEAWRDLMVAKLTALAKELDIDAYHLDQSLICFNDGRGLVDGMTSMQGNVQMQKDLAEALPEIVFSGEGINEINMRYASCLQVHVYGLDSSTQSWDDKTFDQICPVTSAVFSDNVDLYHYPAMCTTSNEDYYRAWYRAGDMHTGHIPTLMRTSYAEIAEPNETMSMMLELIRWYQSNLPTLNTDEDWDDGTILSMKLKSGKIAEYRQDPFGTVLLPDREVEDESLVRFISGVVNVKLPGTISGWKIYDGEFIRGLDPNETYLYSDKRRDQSATHIYELDTNTTAAAFDTYSDYAVVNLKEIEDTSKIVYDFTSYAGPIRAGEVLNDGAAHTVASEFSSKTAFWYTLEQQGQVRHLGDRLLMHPPWIDEVHPIGYTWLEFDVELGVYGNAVFETGAQIASEENVRYSDGVVFKFYAWEKGDNEKKGMVTYEVLANTASPMPVALDITAFEGKTVTVRVECYPNNTTSNDSSVIVSPQVVQRKSSNDPAVSYKIHTEKPLSKLVSSGGKTAYKSLGGNNYQITSFLSETVHFIYEGSEKTSLSYDLTLIPHLATWRYTTGETVVPNEDQAPPLEVAEIRRELKQGFCAQPPANGDSRLDFVVSVPDNGARFDFSVGLKKGSDNSNGAVFVTLVNNDEIWSRTVGAGEDWQEVSLSLDNYKGQTVILSLITSPNGDSAYDYAFWGEPSVIGRASDATAVKPTTSRSSKLLVQKGLTLRGNSAAVNGRYDSFDMDITTSELSGTLCVNIGNAVLSFDGKTNTVICSDRSTGEVYASASPPTALASSNLLRIIGEEDTVRVFVAGEYIMTAKLPSQLSRAEISFSAEKATVSEVFIYSVY